MFHGTLTYFIWCSYIVLICCCFLCPTISTNFWWNSFQFCFVPINYIGLCFSYFFNFLVTFAVMGTVTTATLAYQIWCKCNLIYMLRFSTEYMLQFIFFIHMWNDQTKLGHFRTLFYQFVCLGLVSFVHNFIRYSHSCDNNSGRSRKQRDSYRSHSSAAIHNCGKLQSAKPRSQHISHMIRETHVF